MRKLHLILLAVGCVALSALALGDEPSATPETPATYEDLKAATPGDENQTRIRSIRRNEQFYRSYGRTDLTRALVTGEFVIEASPDICDLNSARLVGLVEGATDKFAMLEDGSGNGYILRVGDKVRNGRITAITENSVVGSISLYGMTSRVVLRLEKKEG